ncbi:MAG: SGNH/GDSL hydrolase family protein [Clostridia bacterium]|nr:SGNH/GDSL hydrolase family protein [Clostridia bacterium]
MSRISDIDKNFKVKIVSDREDAVYLDANNPVFEINGIFYEDGKYRRMPKAVANGVSWGVSWLSGHTAGGRLRFKTDSQFVILKATLGDIGKMPHFALTGSAGFDLYEKTDDKQKYVASFVPAFDIGETISGIINFEDSKMREITINFPLYSEVLEVYIGLQETAEILPPTPYKYKKPIVFYGSSITQGGCASRAGTSYEGFISRRLDTDYINLGFSGNAKGEDAIAEYIKNLDMSIFVYDYDHNAPDTEHLKNTHEKMFETIREANPTLPIVIMSRPKFVLTDDEERRLEIIRQTYNNAIKSGDENVYFLTGRELMALCENEGTVDNCHPTDLGFASIAAALGDLLKKLL